MCLSHAVKGLLSVLSGSTVNRSYGRNFPTEATHKEWEKANERTYVWIRNKMRLREPLQAERLMGTEDSE